MAVAFMFLNSWTTSRNNILFAVIVMAIPILPCSPRKLEKVSELSDRVGDKLEELAEAGEDSWEHLQEGIEHYYQALGNEVKSFNKL